MRLGIRWALWFLKHFQVLVDGKEVSQETPKKLMVKTCKDPGVLFKLSQPTHSERCFVHPWDDLDN